MSTKRGQAHRYQNVNGTVLLHSFSFAGVLVGSFRPSLAEKFRCACPSESRGSVVVSIGSNFLGMRLPAASVPGEVEDRL